MDDLISAYHRFMVHHLQYTLQFKGKFPFILNSLGWLIRAFEHTINYLEVTVINLNHTLFFLLNKTATKNTNRKQINETMLVITIPGVLRC